MSERSRYRSNEQVTRDILIRVQFFVDKAYPGTEVRFTAEEWLRLAKGIPALASYEKEKMGYSSPKSLKNDLRRVSHWLNGYSDKDTAAMEKLAPSSIKGRRQVVYSRFGKAVGIKAVTALAKGELNPDETQYRVLMASLGEMAITEPEAVQRAAQNRQTFIDLAYPEESDRALMKRYMGEQMEDLPVIFEQVLSEQISRFSAPLRYSFLENRGWVTSWLNGEDETSIGRSDQRLANPTRVYYAVTGLAQKFGTVISAEELSVAAHEMALAKHRGAQPETVPA